MTQITPIVGFERFHGFAARTPLAPAIDRFVFLRHGETDGNAARVFQTFDQPLNAAGEAQAVAAATVLAGHAIGRIVASPMARAWRTASLVAAHHGLAPERDDDIQERLYRALWRQPIGDIGWPDDPPGCEPLADFVARVTQGLARALAAPAPRGDVLVVAHGGILLVLKAQLGVETTETMRRNATPLLFERAAGAWRATMLGA